jgi:hypothetical protein
VGHSLFDRVRPHKSSDGFIAAAHGLSRSVSPETKATLDDFRRLNSDAAKVAFADQWLDHVGHTFEIAWPIVYECARVVKDQELFRTTNIYRNVTYASFEEWWRSKMGKSLEEFRELESTYRFAEAAGLLLLPYSEAVERVRTLAVVTPKAMNEEQTREAKAEGAKKGGRGRVVQQQPIASACHAGPIQPDGKRPSNPSGDTSARLTARIARDAPEVLARMKAGEFKSVRKAAIAAGVLKPPSAAKLAARALRHVPPGDLPEVLETLSPPQQAAVRAWVKGRAP